MTETRFLPFEGIENFRDFGAYNSARFGGHVRSGILLRSANHSTASDADLDALNALSLAAVVDLRRPLERDKRPSRRPEGFGFSVIENDDQADDQFYHNQFFEGPDPDVDALMDVRLTAYRNMPYRPRHLDLFRRFFAAVLADKGPVLIHCMAGKDRTGLLAALMQHVLGVHPDDIMADYMLSEARIDIPARAEEIRHELRQRFGRDYAPGIAELLAGVREPLLQAALDVITERSGDLNAYLLHDIGLSDTDQERLRARLLAG